jgi:hypothetical protein
MIPLETELQPRDSEDPAVKVVAIEGDYYILAPTEKFGSRFALDYDGIAAAYVCDGYQIQIQQIDEQALWAQLSSEKFSRQVALSKRNQRKREAAAITPEEFFAKQADAQVL